MRKGSLVRIDNCIYVLPKSPYLDDEHQFRILSFILVFGATTRTYELLTMG